MGEFWADLLSADRVIQSYRCRKPLGLSEGLLWSGPLADIQLIGSHATGRRLI